MSLRFALSAVVPACIAFLTAAGANKAEDTSAAADGVISVTTVFRGATPLEIESDVTLPLEHVLHGLPGIQVVTSTSRDGESVVSLEFSPEHDLNQAKMAVAEAVSGIAAQLPPGAEPPAITTIARDAWPAIWLTLAAEERTPAGLFVAAQRVRERLLRSPNVAEVRILGCRQHELQVRCDPRKLVAYGLSLDRCLRAIERETKGRPLTLEGLLDVVLMLQDLVPVRVRDVADVGHGPGPPDSLAWLDGRSTVAIGVFVRTEVARESLVRIRNELPQIERTVPQDVSLSLTVGAEPALHGGLLVELLAPPRTDLETLRNLADQFERRIRPLAASGVLSVWTRDDDVMRLLFHAKEGVTDEAALIGALRWHKLPGVQSRVAQLPRGPADWRPRYDVELALMGPDRDQLAKWSSAVAHRLADAGYPDAVDEAPAAIADVSLELRRDSLPQLGLDPQSIARTILAYTHGVLLSERGNDRPAMRVFLEDGAEAAERDIASLLIPAGDSLVPLSTLAEIFLVPGVDRLQRRNRRPMVGVTAALPANGHSAPRDSALRLAEEIGRELQLSDEYFAERR